MDQETCDNPRISPKPVQVGENSSDSVLEAVIVLDSERNAFLKGEISDLGVEKDEFGSKKVLIEEQDTKLICETQNLQGNDERTCQDDARSSSNSNDSVREVLLENVIVINSNEAACASDSHKMAMENSKTKVVETVEDSHVIDLKGSDSREGFKEKCDGERVCRICHLSFDQSSEATDGISGNSVNMDLIQIGCGCKEELGIAHGYCAEAWFKLKGNRVCEICGQTAKNITGLGDDSFVEEWDDQRFMDFSYGSSNRRGRCWRGQPFCNFLMACLVIAFVLPWFFHVDMF